MKKRTQKQRWKEQNKNSGNCGRNKEKEEKANKQTNYKKCEKKK